jgi:protein TonB
MGISVTFHVAVLAALIWFVAPLAKTLPPALPQIEFLPPLPITPAPQDAQPSPIDLPIAPRPSLPAQFSPPVPLPDAPPVIQGASQQDERSAPRKPPPKPKQHLTPQPLPIKEIERSETPPAAAPTNGNETKKQTVIAEAPALPQPAGPPPNYLGLINARLESIKQYPPDARAAAKEGVVTMWFSLDRTGRLLSWRLEKSSGVGSLDREATDMVQRAAPFPPFPDSFGKDRLELTVAIGFSLKS